MRKLLILSFIISILFVSCSADPAPESKTGFYLGTVVTVTIYDRDAKELLKGSFDEIQRLENLFSVNISTSDVSRLNAAAGKLPVTVSMDTIEVIKKGIEYNDISRGMFDISIGNLIGIWGIGTADARIPEEEEISAALETKGIEYITIDASDVLLEKEGMKLDVGGIAKGYIADSIARYLKANDCDAAIINLGGNVLTVGEKPDGTKWRVGIQDPSDTTGKYIRVTEVTEKSVITSGSYERYFEEDGIIYHHILDPFTGYPVESDIAGVSIISDLSVDGDGLSTSVFALGYEQGMELIEQIPGVECIIIVNDGSIEYSSGIMEYLD